MFGLRCDSRNPIRLIHSKLRQRSVQAFAVLLAHVQLTPFELDGNHRSVSIENEQIDVVSGKEYDRTELLLQRLREASDHRGYDRMQTQGSLKPEGLDSLSTLQGNGDFASDATFHVSQSK